MVLRQTPDREHGSAMGLLSAFYDLFVGLGSFAAGAVSRPVRLWIGVRDGGCGLGQGCRRYRIVSVPIREQRAIAVSESA